MKRLFIFSILLLSTFSSFAQKDIGPDASFSDRIYFGGGLGFSSSNNATFISLSPIVGYMITPALSAGVGVQYQYIKYRFIDLSSDVYGGSIFTRYNINQFFLQTEYNLLSAEYFINSEARRANFDRLLFGGGIMQPLGSRARLNIIGMYDLIYEPNGPFASPWVFRVFVSL